MPGRGALEPYRKKGYAVGVLGVTFVGTDGAAGRTWAPMKPPGARKASGCPMSYDRGPVRGDPLNHFSQSPLGVRQPAGAAAPMRPGR